MHEPGAKFSEVIGYGANCDAYHMTAPAPDGSGAGKAMKLALNEAGVAPEEIKAISTLMGL